MSFSRALLAVALVAASPSALAAPKKAVAKIPPLLHEVEENYAKAGTISAAFDQINESAALHTKKKSSGNIVVERPNKIRWQTLAPEASLFVSDGRHAWFYTPPFDASEAGQYSEYPASSIRSKLADSLIAGEFSSNRDLKITAVSDHEFDLRPRSGTAGDVVDARVEVDPERKVITRIQFSHADGNHSDIRLSRVVLGKKFGPEVFAFTPPAGAERIQE